MLSPTTPSSTRSNLNVEEGEGEDLEADVEAHDMEDGAAKDKGKTGGADKENLPEVSVGGNKDDAKPADGAGSVTDGAGKKKKKK